MLQTKKYREYIASVDERIKHVESLLHLIRRGVTYEVRDKDNKDELLLTLSYLSALRLSQFPTPSVLLSLIRPLKLWSVQKRR